MLSDAPIWFTTKEAAAYMSYSASTLRRSRSKTKDYPWGTQALSGRKPPKHYKMNKLVKNGPIRYLKKDLDEWMLFEE